MRFVPSAAPCICVCTPKAARAPPGAACVVMLRGGQPLTCVSAEPTGCTGSACSGPALMPHLSHLAWSIVCADEEMHLVRLVLICVLLVARASTFSGGWVGRGGRRMGRHGWQAAPEAAPMPSRQCLLHAPEAALCA